MFKFIPKYYNYNLLLENQQEIDQYKNILHTKYNNNLDLFIYWIQERYKIYLGKRTQDPIFKYYRFTNYSRKLDKTTIFLVDNIYSKIKDKKLLLLNVIIHRNISKIESSKKLKIVKTKDNIYKLISIGTDKDPLMTEVLCVVYLYMI